MELHKIFLLHSLDQYLGAFFELSRNSNFKAKNFNFEKLVFSCDAKSMAKCSSIGFTPIFDMLQIFGSRLIVQLP